MNDKNIFGFTLIEFLVVMGLLAIVFSFGLYMSMDMYRSYAFRSERDLAVSVLQKARSLSIANINEKQHGVHVNADKYIIFEGSAYVAGAVTNINIPFAAASVSHSGMNDVIFNQLAGSVTSPPSAWHFSSGSQSSDISVNSEGRISWSN